MSKNEDLFWMSETVVFCRSFYAQCPVLVAVSHINMVSKYKNYDTQNATKLIMFNLENNKMTLMKKYKQKNNGNKTTLNT